MMKGTDRDEPVDVAGLLLTISPHSSHGLLVIGWVPVRVKHHQAVGANEIQAASTSFAAQHEDEFKTLENRRTT